jgi:Protein of unknown function (DUF2934)
MAVKICCPNNHTTKAISAWEAAVALSAGKQIGACNKCGNELQYRVDHSYSGESRAKRNHFLVTRAIRLGAKMLGRESYDAFLLVLRDPESGAEKVLPTFWSYGRETEQRGGQSAPLLSLAEWKSLFRQLDETFERLEERIRMRAYEIYERRGKTPGRAVDDWLQAEAELTRWQSMQVAA